MSTPGSRPSWDGRSALTAVRVACATVTQQAGRRRQEAELAQPALRTDGGHENGRRSLRRLAPTQPPVVRRVHVAPLAACALARERTRAEGREPALVRDLGE